MASMQDIVTEALAQCQAKEINFWYPSNMINNVVVTFKYQKQPYSFSLARIELKIPEEHMDALVRQRFDRAITSGINACQPMCTGPSTQTQTSSGT